MYWTDETTEPQTPFLTLVRIAIDKAVRIKTADCEARDRDLLVEQGLCATCEQPIPPEKIARSYNVRYCSHICQKRQHYAKDCVRAATKRVRVAV